MILSIPYQTHIKPCYKHHCIAYTFSIKDIKSIEIIQNLNKFLINKEQVFISNGIIFKNKSFANAIIIPFIQNPSYIQSTSTHNPMKKLHQTLNRIHFLIGLDFFNGFAEIHFLRNIGAMGRVLSSI